MSYLLVLIGVFFAAIARAATRRPRGGRPIWAVAMAGSELAGLFLCAAVLVALGFGGLGWSGGPAGLAGSVLLVGSAALFALALLRGFRARTAASESLAGFLGIAASIPRRYLAAAVRPVGGASGSLRIESSIRYGPHSRHLLDRIGPVGGGGLRPALVHVHGGGWWRGRHTTQARPLIRRMARSGWEVFTPAYRLSPEATFPDHVVDVKRSIAWIRAHADELGVDSRFVAIAGGSTGGNIAALVALTGGDPALQPGFEAADTSVQACIPLYGVHDMLRPSGEPLWPYLATSVMKSDPDADPASWRRASPVRCATAHRPAFFVIHGADDTLVTAAMSRSLVEALRAAGGPEVGYLELPWANHGFDFFAGPRGRICAEVVWQVLEHLYEEVRKSGGPEVPRSRTDD